MAARKHQEISDFKLLAVRPRKGCHPKLVKNLQVGELYKFYDGANFYTEGTREAGQHDPVSHITFSSSVPNGLYSVATADDVHRLNISISAIAGKNGSGKSSLVELFCATIFVFSDKKDLMTPTTDSIGYTISYWEKQVVELRKREKDLAKTKIKYERDFNKLIRNKSKANNKETSLPYEDLTYQDAEKAIKEHIRREGILKEKLEEAERRLVENYERQDEYKKMAGRVKADVFYQVNGTCYQLTVDPALRSGAALYKVPGQVGGPIEEIGAIDNHFLADAFFYTIAVNYSHYSLNSVYLGDWIKLLFHKNDGYRTPLVISPMRNAGNFDINDEAGFARTRLLNNLLITEMDRGNKTRGVRITENQVVDEVYFTLDKAKIARIPPLVSTDGGSLRGDGRGLDMIQHFLMIVFENDPYTDPYRVEFALRDVIFNYIIKKIDSISENYIEFQPGFRWGANTDPAENDPFFRKLIDDDTHVTYKLKQAVNFLKYNVDTEGKNRFSFNKRDLKGNKLVRFHFKLSDLLGEMEHPTPSRIITSLPPSIFSVDFTLFNKRDTSSWFSALSSGEQQYIHTVQSIVYHINNIQSAHADPDRIKYRAINIILDEIELYFHPDFQRRFISNLLETFEAMHLRHGGHVEAINILFLTHSPFILSDIPTDNILRLKINSRHNKSLPVDGEFKTFAANIHELLANSFFIDGTLMGKFAEDKINALIERIKKKEELTKEDRDLLDLIGDSYLKSSINRFKELQGYDKN